MNNQEKNLQLIRKEFENKSETIPDKIRLGNQFVDDFIFEDQRAADIPINALRVIFNIISIIRNEQFRPEDRPMQLSLFNEEFESENNIFASMKIRNNKISPSGSTKQVIEAYEFLTKFKMSWYKYVNSKGKEIENFGGLITTPSYANRGYTTFLISSYWLKKIMVIPEYNYMLYNLVYSIRNNKHVIFAIWLSKLPETGTVLKLSTLNEKFGLNYKSANDICFKFLKPIRVSLNKYNNLSFYFKCKGDAIYISSYYTKTIADTNLSATTVEQLEITRRLSYFKKRHGLGENEMAQFTYQYRNVTRTRELIEKSYKIFIKTNRLKGLKSTSFQGRTFLNEIQNIIISLYTNTKMGQLIPNGYPVIT